MMKANVMRTPLIKAGVVLLIFVLLAYLTSTSPEGGVLNSVGQLIIGAFRLVQWSIAMVIGLAVCIAFLIGIFLFAVSLVNKETAASMYAATKVGIGELLAPAFAFVGSFQCKESCGAPAAADTTVLKDELQTIIAGEVKKVTDNQQTLTEQFTALHSKIQALEDKSADFAAAGQLEAIAGEIAASGQVLGAVKENVATLEGKLNATAQQLQALTPDKILGDLPARLEKLEQQGEGFDPKPLTDSIETLQKEMDELKKKGPANTKAKKKG
jgi:hypothetical protein